LRTTDVAIINKIDSADEKSIQIVEDNIKQAKPDSTIIKSESTIMVDKPELIKNKSVLVVEDGTTLTHGEMKIGAGIIAAERIGDKEIVNPEPYTVGSLTDTFENIHISIRCFQQ